MLRAPGILASAMLVLAVCGGGAAPPAGAPTTAPAAATAAAGDAVTVQGFTFKPDTLGVPVGTTVTWTNRDSTPHTTTSGASGTKDGKWRGDVRGSGGTFSFTFAQAGTYTYFCELHEDMKGTITVR
ncbi:MAG: cupredoxin domain-containing protein [Chloroflexi bacterium]|nr:cupredoxin domain-containing protein [Chloroflexota bacterium]